MPETIEYVSAPRVVDFSKEDDERERQLIYNDYAGGEVNIGGSGKITSRSIIAKSMRDIGSPK